MSQQYYGQEELRKELKSLGIPIGYDQFRAMLLDGMPRIPIGKRSVYHLPTVLEWLHHRPILGG